MDLFQHRYYRLNKTLMMLMGQWPYQSSRVRRAFVAVQLCVLTSQIVPQILALVKYRDDWRIIFECVVTFLFEAVCVTKWIGFLCNSQRTMRLLNRIRTDWQVWALDREVNVLHEYAEQGKNMAILYTAAMYSAALVFLTQPVIPKIIDVLLKNGTAPGKFPYPVDYHDLDLQKYYCYIIMYSYVCGLAGATITVANQIMLIIFVQHVCGIFAALGHKLKRLGNNDASVEKGETPYALDKSDMVYLASCIDRHNDAIEYANLIEATYSWSLFFIVGFGMILINALGLQILLRTSDPEATVRFVGYAFAAIIHFFVECYTAQILMDHSFGINLCINNSNWYRVSPKAQKLLQFMTMRSSIPCQLTAGKFLIMSVRTFGQTMRAAMSYFTLVRSTQM